MVVGEVVTLLGSVVSPYSARARIALNLKGAEYDFLPQDLINKSEVLIESNPVYKKVPVLIHNGKTICESMIIVEYIDQVWSSSGVNILPTDPYERSIARFWAAYIDDKCFSGMFGICIAPTEEAKKAATEQVSTALSLLEEAFGKCSNGGEFFGGETIGYLDIALGCYLGWLQVSEIISQVKFLDEDKTHLLVGWAQRFRAAEAVKGTMPEVDELLKFINPLQDKYGVGTRAS